MKGQWWRWYFLLPSNLNNLSHNVNSPLLFHLFLPLFLPLSPHLQAFDQSELLECIRRLVEIDQDWVPHSDSASVYIRPTFISTEVRRSVVVLLCLLVLERPTTFVCPIAAISGCQEAFLCFAVCDLVSSGSLLQHRCKGPLLVGRPKVHSGLERRNWRLQDGRVGRHILYACFSFHSLIIDPQLGDEQKCRPIFSTTLLQFWFDTLLKINTSLF